MEREYQGFIFSHHALDRVQDRSVTQDSVVSVLRHPEKTFPGHKPGTTKFIRTLNDRRIHVVASYLVDQKKWLVISVWVRGEEDKVPFAWQLITLPFKVVWWLIKLLLKKTKN